MKEKTIPDISSVSNQPGVYLFKNKSGNIIYVGKAKNLKNRVRTYFQSSHQSHPKLRAMVNHIASVETIIVDNEVEALLLESNLIKKYKPRYNINLKDDKSYPYIRITKEPFPRVFLTRKKINDGSTYIGPFTDVKNLRKIMSGIRKIFPIRSCKLNLTPETIEQGKFKICLDYHINRCQGPCEAFVTEEEYNRMIQQVIRLLKGKTRELVTELKKEMHLLSENLNFEHAAKIRDRIHRVENFFFTPAKVEGNWLNDMDIIAFSQNRDDGVFVIFQIRDGRGIGRQHFYMNQIEDKTPNDIFYHFMITHYIHREEFPPEALVQEEFECFTELRQSISQLSGSKFDFIIPKIGDKKKLMSMVQKNADFLLSDLLLQRTKREEKVHHSVVALQRDLNLATPPLRIETFDISNIQGKFPVASMVHFRNGKPLKSQYRHYHIRSQDTPDDFRMMREVIERRYSRILKENEQLPDLIVIDGGKGQLSSALAILKKLNILSVPVIGLAKRLEEIFIPGKSEPLLISKTSPSLQLLQRMRDEAHRFAITFHRKTRDKYNLHSELDDIPYIGEIRKKNLLRRFKTVDAIRSAAVDELTAVPGVNRKAAEAIISYFKSSS